MATELNETQRLRGRPVTNAEAQDAAQRFINKHFGMANGPVNANRGSAGRMETTMNEDPKKPHGCQCACHRGQQGIYHMVPCHPDPNLVPHIYTALSSTSNPEGSKGAGE